MSKFIFAGTEFNIDFDKIYEKLSISEKQSFDSCEFLKRYNENKDWVKRAKYIVYPPFDENMVDESALMYIMLFGDERDISRDKIQINNFAFRANLILNQFTKEQREEFFSLIQCADYSYIIKKKLRGKEINDHVYQIDKCVSFFFDEPQFENVFRISLYNNGRTFKAQQWTVGNKDELIKGEKETVNEEVFWGIMLRAIDLMFQEDEKNYGEIAEKCADKVKEYFLGSTEETVSSYELKNLVYEYAIKNGFINPPKYIYDPSKFIPINTFESKNYTRSFLISKDCTEFIIGSQINQAIDLDTEKNMVYKTYDKKTFNSELIEAVINAAHRERTVSFVSSVSKIGNVKTLNNIQDFIIGNRFDFDEFKDQLLHELCAKEIVAINPYTFYDSLTTIPNTTDKLFAFNDYRNIYLVCDRDTTGIINKTKITDRDTFINSLKTALSTEYPGRFDLNKITMELINSFSGVSGTFNVKNFITSIEKAAV